MKKYPMSVRVLLGALVLLVIPALVAAQQPDLSGTWVLNQEKSTVPDTGGRGFGGGASQMVIKMDGENIVITSTTQGRQGSQERTQTYTPDGEKHTMEATGGRGGTSEVMAEWKDAKLVISTSRSTQQGSFTTSMTYSIQEDGTLLLETQRPDMGGRGGGVTKLVYDKK